MNITSIPLAQLRAHPLNSNVMHEQLLTKLVDHIERSGQYPPLIVRRMDDQSPDASPSEGDSASGVYQVLDGHHRWLALQRVGHEAAACVVWDVDDAGALLLLSTLNRLQGQDDPRKRSRLLCELREKLGQEAGALAKLLPESAEQVRKYLELREKLPQPQAPRGLGEMPVAVTFFLTGSQKAALDAKLATIGGPRETALMKLATIEA
ncbi:ParB N-terminal domain-containing protein [Planctomycetales bacterium ZRK34]|nr:ParB N-terminal domain-containing protein [Planctomycetales bacterium ZRK34]